MGATGPVSLEEVSEVLTDRLRFLRRDPPARRWGRVFTGSIEEARGCQFSTVFLPGLSEGLFPQRMLEDPLLLDQFRKRLDPRLPLRSDQVSRERHRLRLALAAARDSVVASYSRMDTAEARPRVPSFYALELPRVIAGGLPALDDFERQARDACQTRLNWPAPKQAIDAIDDAEYDLVALDPAASDSAGRPPARHLIDANPHLARSLRARYARWDMKAWKEADGLITRDPSALAALESHRLKSRVWSASSLEQFAQCPYKFALHGIAGLRPREETTPLEQLDPRTRGALFHAVQFALLSELRAEGQLPVTPANLPAVMERAEGVLERVAGNYEEQLVPAIPRVWRTEMEDLRTDMRGWLQHMSQHDDDWHPFLFELAFGLEPSPGRDPASRAEAVELEAGVRLRGSIDMLERNVRTKALRVTDHKTGKPPEMVPNYVGGGRALQPLLYAQAASRIIRETVDSSRLFYATQRGGYQYSLIPATKSAGLFLARVLEDIDQAIASGFLPPVPEEKACSLCDYREVCGPYEEYRTSRRKDRKDVRLEPLFEIRGFA